MRKFTRKQLLGLICIVIGMIVIALYYYFANIIDVSRNEGGFFFRKEIAEENIGPVSPGQDVVQSFTATRDGLTGLSLAFQAVGDVSQTEVSILLQEQETGATVQRWDVQAAQILTDGSFQFFPFSDVLNNSKGKSYNIIISAEDAAGESTISLMKTKSSKYGQLEVGGNNDDGNLALKMKGFMGYIEKIYAIMVIILICASIWIYYIVFVLKDWKYEKLFLAFGLFLIPFYLLIFTPYTEPDSTGHMASVYYYTDKVLEGKQLDEDGKLLVTQDEARRGGLSVDMGLANLNTVKENLFSRDKNEEEYEYTGRNPLSSPFIAHLPQIAGAIAGKILNLGTVPVLMLVKIFAGLFYLICCYYAIKFIPFGKLTMFVCALLPLSIEMNTSSSYDNVAISLALLIIGYELYLVYKKEKVVWKDIILLSVLNMWLAPVKVVYFLVSGLCILIPANKLKKKNQKYMVFAVVMLAGMIAVMVTRLGFVSVIASGGSAGGTTFTLQLILSDPVNSFCILMRTILERTPEFLRHVFGGIYSWFNISVSLTFVFGFMAIAFLSVLVHEDEEVYLDKKAKICMVVIAFIITGCTVMGLWLSWTPKEAVMIEGIQGRYFLPYLPLILFLFRNKCIVLKKKIDSGVLIAFFILHYVTILNLFGIVVTH